MLFEVEIEGEKSGPYTLLEIFNLRNDNPLICGNEGQKITYSDLRNGIQYKRHFDDFESREATLKPKRKPINTLQSADLKLARFEDEYSVDVEGILASTHIGNEEVDLGSEDSLPKPLPPLAPRLPQECELPNPTLQYQPESRKEIKMEEGKLAFKEAILFIKPYTGKRDKIHLFVRDCEKAFKKIKKPDEDSLLLYIVSQLEGKEAELIGNRDFQTWDSLKLFLNGRFQGITEINVMSECTKFSMLKQGQAETTQEYYNRAWEQKRKILQIESGHPQYHLVADAEKELVKCFAHGLRNQQHRFDMGKSLPKDLETALETLEKWEEIPTDSPTDAVRFANPIRKIEDHGPKCKLCSSDRHSLVNCPEVLQALEEEEQIKGHYWGPNNYHPQIRSCGKSNFYVDVVVNGFPAKALLDTGADSSVASNEMPMRNINVNSRGELLGFGGSTVPIATGRAVIEVGPTAFEAEFHIVEKDLTKPYDVYLGLDIIEEQGWIINIKEKYILIGTVKVPINLAQAKDFRVSAIHNTQNVGHHKNNFDDFDFKTSCPVCRTDDHKLINCRVVQSHLKMKLKGRNAQQRSRRFEVDSDANPIIKRNKPKESSQNTRYTLPYKTKFIPDYMHKKINNDGRKSCTRWEEKRNDRKKWVDPESQIKNPDKRKTPLINSSIPLQIQTTNDKLLQGLQGCMRKMDLAIKTIAMNIKRSNG